MACGQCQWRQLNSLVTASSLAMVAVDWEQHLRRAAALCVNFNKVNSAIGFW